MTLPSLSPEQVVIRYHDEHIHDIEERLTEHGHSFDSRLKKRLFIRRCIENPPSLSVRQIVFIFQGFPLQKICDEVLCRGHLFSDHAQLVAAVRAHHKKLSAVDISPYKNKLFKPGARKVVLVDCDSYDGKHNSFIASFDGAAHFYSRDENSLPKQDLNKGIVTHVCDKYKEAADHEILKDMFVMFHQKTIIHLITKDNFLRNLKNSAFFKNRLYVL